MLKEQCPGRFIVLVLQKNWVTRYRKEMPVAVSVTLSMSKALDHFKCAVNIAKELGDKEAVMLAYGGLGKAFEHLGNLRKAEEYTNLRLNLAKEIGNECEEGGAYCNLGHIFFRLGDFIKSIECYNRQLKLPKKLET